MSSYKIPFNKPCLAGNELRHVTEAIQMGRSSGDGLVGVDAEYQGRQIGSALVRQALSWFQEQRVSDVSVVTQGRNVAAQRLYQRCGFLTSSVQVWYHLWMDEAAA